MPDEANLLKPRAMGQALARRDGELKVRGTATYASDTPADRPAYAQIVQASVARGRVTGVSAAAAGRLDGVLAVLTAGTADKLPFTGDRELAVRSKPTGSTSTTRTSTPRAARESAKSASSAPPPPWPTPFTTPPASGSATFPSPSTSSWPPCPEGCRRLVASFRPTRSGPGDSVSPRP